MITQDEAELLKSLGYSIADVDLQGGASVLVKAPWNEGYTVAQQEITFIALITEDKIRALSAYSQLAGAEKGRKMAYCWYELVKHGKVNPDDLMLYENAKLTEIIGILTCEQL